MLKTNEYAIFHLWQNPGFKPQWQDLSPMVPQRMATEASNSPQSPMSPRLSRRAKQPNTSETFKSVMQTLKENLKSTQGLLYALTFVFLITLLLYPGTTADTYFVWINNMNLAN